MFFTRRAAERPALGRVLPHAAVALLLLGAAASCSDDPAAEIPETPDVSPPPQSDGGAPSSDASADAPEDVVRLEVTCTVTPCVRDLSASWSESFCARLDDGRVSCWGRNETGELGRDAGSSSATPVFVEGVSGATALDRTCAVVEGGRVQCWGPAPMPTPAEDAGALPPARAVASADSFVCAVLTDGKLACWGKHGIDGVFMYADAGGVEADIPPTVVPLEGPVDEVAIARAFKKFPDPPPFCTWCPPAPPPMPYHAVVVRFTNGAVSSWGLTPVVGRPTEQRPDPRPARIHTERADHVFGGHGGCVVQGATLGCWGYGRDDLGDDVRPLPIPLVSRAVQATLGKYGEGHFGRGCAATPEGAVYCWGTNDYGQAGDGTREFRDLPVRVANLSEPIVRVEATEGTTCALGVSGRVYCWGDDGYGQRGQRTPFHIDPSPLPVEFE